MYLRRPHNAVVRLIWVFPGQGTNKEGPFKEMSRQWDMCGAFVLARIGSDKCGFSHC